MEPVSIAGQLAELLGAHGISYHLENEWVVPNGELPAICGTWFPREFNGVLQVEVLIEPGVTINECFAGMRTGEEGILDAIENFCVNSFHVLLAAFWGQNDADQVTTESWLVCGNRYTAYIGNLGTRSNTGEIPELPEDLFPSIEKEVKSTPATEDTLWIRHFFCNIDGDPTYECLLNNEVWDRGLENLKSQKWQKSSGYYSVRNFMVLRADA